MRIPHAHPPCATRYIELLVVFDMLDTSDDRVLDRDEFKKALPTVLDWGVAVSEPDKVFDMIDRDKGGVIAFEEFAGWAINQGLDIDPGDNVDGEESLDEHHM